MFCDKFPSQNGGLAAPVNNAKIVSFSVPCGLERNLVVQIA